MMQEDGKVISFHRHVITPDGLPNVEITHDFVEYQIYNHPNEKRVQFANFVLPTLQQPGEVWLQAIRKKGRVRYQTIYFAAFPVDGKITNFILVVRGERAWTFFPADRKSYVNKQRKGKLLYRQKED